MEPRRLLAWSNYAQLIGQDDVATRFASISGAGQTIAMIDTGIDYTHPSLGSGFGAGKKVVGGYDFYANDADPMDTDGHGTMTAGLVAANAFTRDGVTYQGVAPDAKLVALRVGTGDDITDDNIEAALQWVIANHESYGITVVNISLGSGAYATATTARSQLADEFAQLETLGVFAVAASGNSGTTSGGTVAYPAADPNVFAAGSVDAAGQISDFTQRGRELDLLAPGEAVVTTARGGGYSTIDGTSFSSPIVAGAAAMVRQAASTLGVSDVASILRTSSQTQYDGDGDGGRATGEVYAQLDLVNALVLTQARGQSAKLDNLASSKSTTVDTAYDASGVLHLTYYDASAGKVMYAVRQSDGRWTTPYAIERTTHNIGAQLSLAIDQTGKPAIAYYDATDADLKYAWFNGSNWLNTTLDSSKSVGQSPSLVFNDAGEARIAYYRKSGGDLRLASFDRSTGQWTRRVVDSEGDVGLGASLAYHVSGGTYTLAVAYADKTNGNLKYWRYNSDPIYGGEYSGIVEDAEGVGNIDLKLIETSDGAAARIAYQDLRNTTVKVAYRADDWFSSVISNTGSSGQSVSSYVDGAGRYHVVYYSRGKGGTYDAVVSAGNLVSSLRRIGTMGQAGSVAFDDEGRVTLVGLNKARKSINVVDLA